jgi:superfamily I DNA and/or RNA helicase
MARKEIQEELTILVNLLRREKEEDLKQYNMRMQNSSFIERRKNGVCWYPVRIEKTSYSSAERPILRISRNIEHKESHLFQSGKLIRLFSNAQNNSEETETVNGVINQVRDHEMLITLNANDTPDWVYDGKLGVQLLFDENSYKEMEYGLKKLLTTTDQHIEELKNILLGDTNAEFKDASPINLPELNVSQNLALNKVLTAKQVAIIHGPPGTGKTTTLIQSIIQTLKIENQVLVCAPSNAAIDLIVEKLGQENVNVVRIGHPARVTEEVLSNTLDNKITKHQQYKELKSLRKSAVEYRNLGHKYKRNFGQEEREQRHAMLSEAKRFKVEADLLANYIKDDILNKTKVIATTLIGANNFALKDKHFSTVFIDEAAQGLEPAAWLPIIKSDRVIFAGDHCQLPPTIKSFDAAKKGLEITLFEKAIKRNHADTMLTEQYRMHQTIMKFSSKHFYKNQLIANKTVANWTIFPEDLPIEFIDTAGTGFFEQTNLESKSSLNPEEKDLLFQHLQNYLENIALLKLTDSIDKIGIISPYKAQVTLMQEAFTADKPFNNELAKKININTIDSFQGQERDIIYISLVRSNEKGEIGFLADTRRMNVAMTRARKKLVIIGDSATIGNHPFYNEFINYINEIGAYKSAFEYIA